MMRVRGVPLWIIARAAGCLALARLMLLFPTRTWVAWLRCEVSPYSPSDLRHVAIEDDPAQALHLRALKGVARRVPWRANCLPQAIALLLLSGEQASRHRIVLGTGRLDRKAVPAEGMRAHAWVEQDGHIVLGEEGCADFTPVACIERAESRD